MVVDSFLVFTIVFMVKELQAVARTQKKVFSSLQRKSWEVGVFDSKMGRYIGYIYIYILYICIYITKMRTQRWMYIGIQVSMFEYLGFESCGNFPSNMRPHLRLDLSLQREGGPPCLDAAVRAVHAANWPIFSRHSDDCKWTHAT